MECAPDSAQLMEAFMTRTIRLEEMQKFSSQLLSGYHQELDLFRRPPIHESSTVVAGILENNPSLRVSMYQQAGCRHLHSDQQVAVKLDAYIRGLQDHIQEAREYIEEIRQSVERATCMMHDDLGLMLEKVNLSPSKSDPHGCKSEQRFVAEGSNCRHHSTTDYAVIMSAIFSMLEKDFHMQEKIVADIGLETPSELLENYCLMWTLRPFIDEKLIGDALSWIGR